MEFVVCTEESVEELGPSAKRATTTGDHDIGNVALATPTSGHIPKRIENSGFRAAQIDSETGPSDLRAKHRQTTVVRIF